MEYVLERANGAQAESRCEMSYSEEVPSVRFTSAIGQFLGMFGRPIWANKEREILTPAVRVEVWEALVVRKNLVDGLGSAEDGRQGSSGILLGAVAGGRGEQPSTGRGGSVHVGAGNVPGGSLERHRLELSAKRKTRSSTYGGDRDIKRDGKGARIRLKSRSSRRDATRWMKRCNGRATLSATQLISV